MFVPKNSSSQSPTGASASPEAVQLAMITRYIESLNSPTNAVVIPFLISIVSGILAAFEMGALYLIYHYPNSIFSWMLIGMMSVVVWLWYVFVKSRRESLNALEWRLNLDLNGDGVIGSKPEPRKIVSQIEIQTKHGTSLHFEDWGGLPDFTIKDAAWIVKQNGYRVSQALLCGADKPLVKANNKLQGVGRASYDVFIGALTDAANGWGTKGSHGEVILTDKGREQIDLICEDENE